MRAGRRGGRVLEDPPELRSQATQPSHLSWQSALPSLCPHTKSLGSILPGARAGTTQARGSTLIFPDGGGGEERGRRERQDEAGEKQLREVAPAPQFGTDLPSLTA